MKAPDFLILLILLVSLCGCRHTVNKGIITEKGYRSSGTILVPFYNGKTTTLMPVFRPEEFFIVVEDSGVSETFVVESNFFYAHEVGDSVHINYKK